MRPATDIVRRILQTEKGTRVAKADQYCLEVALDSTKPEIRQAVQELFKVKVTQVNTQIGHGKWRRLSQRWGQRSDRKKAFVTLEKGQKIEVKS